MMAGAIRRRPPARARARAPASRAKSDAATHLCFWRWFSTMREVTLRDDGVVMGLTPLSSLLS